MTEQLNDLDTPSDAELISRVRGGDVAAYGVLFSRHREAANRLARQLVRGPDADDLTSEAFAKVLGVLQRGGGPDVSFRAYLLTAVRRLHVDRVRSGKRLQTTDDMTPFDPGVPFQDTTVAAFENGAAAKAFASLPERWQLVLWHLEVEQQKPADIAPLLGMSANSVSALAYRAREGLRQAFLTMHLSDISETECRWVNEHLGAFVRKGLSKRDTTRVQTHLDGCRRCTAMYLELTEVNSNLSAIIAPLLLGTAAAGYVASISGSGGALGALSLVGRVKELAAANSGGVAAGAVALGVATAAAVTFALTQTGGEKPSIVADPPAAITTTPAGPVQSPEATRTPTPTRSPSARSSTPAPSSSTTSTATSGSTPSATSTADPPLSAVPLPPGSLAPATPPSGGPGGQPSGRPSPSAPGGPSPSTPGGPSPSTPGGPSPSSPGAPSPSSPGAPSPTTPGAPTPATRVVDPPVGSDAGSMTVTAHDLRAVDTLTVAMVSLETTFAADPPTGCRVVVPLRVECDLSRAAEDFSVTLPLEFPAAMVADQLQVTAAVVGVPTATASATWTFEPARTPAFDFAAPVLDPTSVHRVDGEVDRYDFTTTAVLPPRVQGLVYLLGDGARFRAADAGSCTVTRTSTMTCPDVGNGDRVALPLQAESLAAAEDVGLSVRPLLRFDDPPADNRTTLTLRPGVDLSLTDPVAGQQSPLGVHLVVVRLGGQQRAMSTLTFTLTGDATFICSPAEDCSPKTLTTSGSAPGPVTLPVRVDNPLGATAVAIEAEPGEPYDEVEPADNTVRVRLAPDLTMASVFLTPNRPPPPGRALVRATVSGAPTTLTEIRIGVSGAPAAQVGLTDGAEGADGEGDVDCYTSDADGTAAQESQFATCTNVRIAPNGRFYVDMRVTRPLGGVRTPVTFAVQGVGVDEDGKTANNTKTLTIG
jgi:RNA polymerase sigma factor (sigma-70 family)